MVAGQPAGRVDVVGLGGGGHTGWRRSSERTAHERVREKKSRVRAQAASAATWLYMDGAAQLLNAWPASYRWDSTPGRSATASSTVAILSAEMNGSVTP